jgi:hypothetical protein
LPGSAEDSPGVADWDAIVYASSAFQDQAGKLIPQLCFAACMISSLATARHGGLAASIPRSHSKTV